MDADSFTIETYQIKDDGTVEPIDEAFTIEKTGDASAEAADEAEDTAADETAEAATDNAAATDDATATEETAQ